MLNTDWTPLIVCPKQMSMKRCDVRPSVCSSMGSQQQTRCCRSVAFCGPGKVCGGRMRTVRRCQRTKNRKNRRTHYLYSVGIESCGICTVATAATVITKLSISAFINNLRKLYEFSTTNIASGIGIR